MTATQTRTLARIDAERRSCAAAIRGRLMRADKRGDDLGDAIKRLSFIAYLRGMKRTVLDASNAIGKDARAAHYALSRADEDEKDEKDRLLWLLAFLGLTWTTVEFQRYQAERVATNAGDELRGAGLKRAAKLQEQADVQSLRGRTGSSGRGSQVGSVQGGVRTSTAGAVSTTNAPDATRLYEPGVGTLRNPAVESRPRQAGKAPDSVRRSVLTDDSDVFGRFGKANVIVTPQSAIDVWAETVAYTQYEAGRYDAGREFPAISDALWGYRWSSVLDGRETIGCHVLDGWVAPISDPYMKELAPPRHFRCRSALIPIWQSSALKKPVEVKRPSDASLARYLAEKEKFLRTVA